MKAQQRAQLAMVLLTTVEIGSIGEQAWRSLAQASGWIGAARDRVDGR